MFIPHTLLNVNNHQAKILLINAQNRQQTLSKNTRIGTISYDTTFSICTTIQDSTESESPQKHQSLRKSKNFKTRAISYNKDNSDQTVRNNRCHRCNEYFLSGNDLQKHLRVQCYLTQIRQQIIESTAHIENPKHQLVIQDIL